jgi:hypothetical protein
MTMVRWIDYRVAAGLAVVIVLGVQSALADGSQGFMDQLINAGVTPALFTRAKWRRTRQPA